MASTTTKMNNGYLFHVVYQTFFAVLDAMMMAREQERQAADLREARSRLESEVLETRAKLMLTAHRAEVEAASQLQNRLSLLNHKRPAPNRSSSLVRLQYTY